MSWTRKAALAACTLAFAWPAKAQTAQTGQWLNDGACALFNADAHPGDTVHWTGACANGKASGLGTATFTSADGKAQSFTADFVDGQVPDGYVATRWGQGWSYEGEAKGGVFEGAGVLTTDGNDRFEGQWKDGKMNGFGVLRRANGERYAGDWKDDKPNGNGELRHADGTLIKGVFTDGRLASDAPLQAVALAEKPKPVDAPFSTVSGKTLTGVDGSTIALNLIEGGMELQRMPGGGSDAGLARKTTFTFMTDRMGTVVEDQAAPAAGTSVTGFFRLTASGVEVRYADGRSAMLSAIASKDGDGGVQMTLDGEAGASCQAWYPQGHTFSEAEKRAALNAYAGRLGLPVTVANGGCGATVQAAPVAAEAAPKLKTSRTEVKVPSRLTQAAYHVGDFKELEPVSVRASQVHAIDADAPMPTTRQAAAALAPPQTDGSDPSKCLKVDSDGSNWGFRNACGFAVQFAYCLAGSDDKQTLAACDAKDSRIAGSVAANGFGALTTDTSLKDRNAGHNFRWIACKGGAGQVVAHLDTTEPPSGRCERVRTASNEKG